MLSGSLGRLLVVIGCIAMMFLAAERAAVRYFMRAGEDVLWDLQPAEAIRAFEAAGHLDPLGVAPDLGRADALLDLAEEMGLQDAERLRTLEASRDQYLDVLRRDPRHPTAWAQLGRAYASLAITHRASRVIDISELGNPEALRRPEDAHAVVALRRAVALEPGNYDFANYLAELLWDLGDPDALEWFRRGTAILPKINAHRHLWNPNTDPQIIEAGVQGIRSALGSGNVVADPQILSELALFHSRRGEVELALQANAEAIAPLEGLRSQEYRLAWLWNRQGVWLERAGRRAEARKALERALSLDAGRGPAHYMLGLLSQRDGDLESAVEHMRRARNSTPGALRYQMELGRMLEGAGNPEEAAREFQRALLLEDGTVPAASALVNLYRGLRQYDKAITYARILVEESAGETVYRRQLDELAERLTF